MGNKLLFLIIAILIIISGVFFIFQFQKGRISIIKETSMPELLDENSKKAAVLIAFRNFRDEEYFVPKEILESGGVKVVTVSTQEGIAIGADGGDVKIDLTLDKLNIEDYAAIIFIGGPGALDYLDNEDSYRIVRETIKQNKILAAICIAPTILARSGALEGKKATVWASPLDKSSIKTLRENRVEFIEKAVVQDGSIITANGPAAAKEFGEKIIDTIKELTGK